jgi:Ca-activated chloride channel family protein
VAIRPVPPIPPRPPDQSPRWDVPQAELARLKVDVEIRDQVAVTELDQTFRNPSNRRLEGTYLFPLPPDAAVKDMSLYIDGKAVECEVVEAQKARQIYEGIVRSMRDPALLEYVGRDLVRLRIFPIEPLQERRVTFKYSQVMRRDFDLFVYSYPLITREGAQRPIGELDLKGMVATQLPITSIYSPTHDIVLDRRSDTQVKFSFNQKNQPPQRDFKLYIGTHKSELGADLIVYRDPDGPGTFMLLLAPQMRGAERKTMPKDVTFVFDTSGSMAGEKINQARNALKYCLNSLRERDRFRLIRFSTEIEDFSKEPLDATKENVQRAVKFVDDLRASGGTAIRDALMAALDSRGSNKEGRPSVIVFLTDGQPTVGETGVERIVEDVAKRNEAQMRVFSFGVGYGVNTRLLDTVSDNNGGVADYVAPEEDIEVKVSNFFSKIADPVLTDVSLDFKGVDVSDLYPRKLPDLFAGSQITLLGHYRGDGPATVVLSGKVCASDSDDHSVKLEKKVFEYELKFPRESREADFLPRLWAIRRVGHLMDEIRKNGEETELREEVIRLGKEYAIATPYTSLLVVEDEPAIQAQAQRVDSARPQMAPAGGAGGGEGRRSGGFFSGGVMRKKGAPVQDSQPMAMGAPERAVSQDRSALVKDSVPRVAANEGDALRLPGNVAGKPAQVAMRADTGQAAVEASKQTRAMKEKVRIEPEKADTNGQIRQVAGRTFYLKKGVWTDSRFDEKQKTEDLEYGSQAYFDLLAKNKGMGEFLALGEQVIFEFQGKWYRITSPGK